MQRMAWILVGFGALCSTSRSVTAEDAPAVKRKSKYTVADSELVIRSYAVADLVTPIPSVKIPAIEADHPPKRPQPRNQALIEHLRRITGAKAWRDDETSFRYYAPTMSLVIRQTSAIHEKIAEEMGRMRMALDTQVALELQIVTGRRSELAELAAAYAGELGRSEKEDLSKKIQATEACELTMAPKITLFSRTAASVKSSDQTVTAYAAVSDDRRQVQLKLALAATADAEAVVSTCQVIDLHDGRSAAVYFEAEPVLPGTTPTDDAQERLVIVTPTIIVLEEDEEVVSIAAPKD